MTMKVEILLALASEDERKQLLSRMDELHKQGVRLDPERVALVKSYGFLQEISKEDFLKGVKA